MRKKERYSLFFMLFAVCWTIPLLVGAEGIDVHIKSQIVQESVSTRSFRMNTQIWSGEKDIQKLPASATVILLEVSDDMMALADTPDEKDKYAAGLTHKSMDRSTLLYTLEGEEYKPLVLQDNQYFIVGDTEGEKKIGDFNFGNPIFTQVVYQKGKAQTKLEKMKQELSAFLSGLADLSPNSQIMLIYCGNEITQGEQVQLNADGLQKILAELETCEQYKGTQTWNQEAFSKSYEFLNQVQKDGIEQLSLISILGSITDGNTEEIKNDVQRIKTLGTSVYAIQYQDQDLSEEENQFLGEFASQPAETYVTKTDALNLANTFETVMGKLMQSIPIELRLALDSRFEISEEKKAEIEADGGKVTTDEEGNQTVTWEVSLPRTEKNAWEKKLTIKAKNAFIGGNDVPLLKEESGVYWYGQQKQSVKADKVNVPVVVPQKNIKSEILLGEAVPEKIENKSLLAELFAGQEPQWYAQEKTGSLSYLWRTEAGGTIGTVSQLKEIIPIKDEKYIFSMDYKPASSGEKSVGVPCQAIVSESAFEVKVLSGSVRILVHFTEEEAKNNENNTFLFQLAGKDFLQYKTIGKQNRNQDGENITWEVEFDHLPFGRYTLKNVTDEAENQEEIVCRVGIADGSDVMSKENAQYTVVFYANKIQQNDRIVIAERKFRIASEE